VRPGTMVTRPGTTAPRMTLASALMLTLVLLVRLLMFVVAVVFPLMVAETSGLIGLHDEPVTPVSAEETCRLVCAQMTALAATLPRSWVTPLSEPTGESARATDCANAGVARPTV